MSRESKLIIIFIIILIIIYTLFSKNEEFGCDVETKPICNMIPNCVWVEGSCPISNCNTICNKYFITTEEIIKNPIVKNETINVLSKL